MAIIKVITIIVTAIITITVVVVCETEVSACNLYLVGRLP